ncbi:MAG TPA: chain-length determining protein [Ligilactobacillus acidipiscis]|uniref:Capsular polysaccharide biosynthesis protein CpsC n=1 Tax=Ligilactobacillus acidipiscis TaxID=89059 RepID=A0A921F9Z5_9LACO|nr:chain-length determining protein [Ligilactobacillus acidipiscis]
MNVTQLVSIIKKNILSIVLWALGGVVVATLYAFIIVTPQYKASVDLLVNQKTDNTQAQYTAQQTDLQAVNTYKDVLRKPVILGPVSNQLKKSSNYQGGTKRLQRAVSIGNELNSRIITVSVKDSNAYVAANAANMIGSTFTKKIKKIMKVDNVTVVSKAKPNTRPVSPNKKLFLLIGLVAGMFIGAMVAVIKDLLDTTIHDSYYLSNELGITDLGAIYHIDDEENVYQNLYILDKKRNATSECKQRRRV